MINTFQQNTETRITFFHSIRGKLVLLFLAVSLIPLAIVGGVAITQLNIAQFATSEVSDNYFPSIVNLDNAQIALLHIVEAQKNHIIAPDDKTMRFMEIEIKTQQENLTKALAGFESTLDIGIETEAFKKFQGVLSAFLTANAQVIVLSQNNDDDKAQMLSVGIVNDKLKNALSLMKTMHQTNIVGSNEAKLMAEKAVRTGMTLTLIVSLVFAIIVILVALWVSHSIAKPILLITEAAHKLATGDTTLTGLDPIEVKKISHRRDEIGHIGQTFDELSRYFKEVINDIVQISQGLAKGNLHTMPQAEYRGDFVQIKNALETALSDQRRVVEDIVQVSQGLADGNLRVTPKAEYQGDFVQIKNALKTALSDLLLVIEDIVRVSRGLAEGNLRVMPEGKYRGDFAQVKNALETTSPDLLRQVEDLVLVSNGLADGNLNTKPQAEYKGDFVQIKNALGRALFDLQEVVGDIVQVSQGLATGNLRVVTQIEYKGDFIQIKNALDTAIPDLRLVITDIVRVSQGLAEGGVNIIPEGEYQGDFVQIKDALETAGAQLSETTTKNTTQDWFKTGQAQLNDQMSGTQEIATLAKNIISFLTTYIKAQVGLFYLLKQPKSPHQKPYLKVIAGYAYTPNDNIPTEFLLGDGLVGQAALEKKPIYHAHIPEEYTPIIQSGMAKSIPRYILMLPFLYENEVKGVIEIGSTQALTSHQQNFLGQVMSSIGIALNTAESRTQMQKLLQQSQTQTEELQSQSEELQSQQEEMQQINEELQHQREELEEKQEELQHRNEELQNQSEELQTQSEELQTQQEELRQTNEVLEERSQDLERQKQEVQHKNIALEKTQQSLEFKVNELEMASQYKSEFLANMSHELRTPLNSLLILSQLLTENKDDNLSNKQVEYAQTIHSAGSDLLILINDILDLSKVEAGKMEIQLEKLSLPDLVEALENKFIPVAEGKNLAFRTLIAEGLPAFIHSDRQRLKQILNNLLSNAFKFTNQGEVKLTIDKSSLANGVYQSGKLSQTPTGNFAISVTDTGIGIPEDKKQLIFDAFQQVDGTTSRRYGGTGLGLSISRQLAKLLGGDISISSIEGEGSTFTLHLPETVSTKTTASQSSENIPVKTLISTERRIESLSDISTQQNILQDVQDVEVEPLGISSEEDIIDDRNTLKSEDKSLLIIEDDRKFSTILMELAQGQDFKCLLAEDGRTGLQLAEEYKPNAIILDAGLPQLDGWIVMDKLKDNPDTRHIPVHFISASDQGLMAKKMGAIGFLHKPVSIEEIGKAFKKIEQFLSQTAKNLLVIVDSEPHQHKIMELVGSGDVEITIAMTMTAALQHLKTTVFDCIILDMEVEQGAGSQLLEKMDEFEGLCQTPLIIYTNRELTTSEEALLQQCAERLPVKSVKSPEQLLDEATLFLHQLESNLPKEKRNMLKMVHDKEAILKDNKVLIVDDDMRNVFALATVLEDKGMEVAVAQNGKEALTVLETQEDIAIVLMDIMMPEMDGYEAMQAIRKQRRYHKLPIIALTAKAMKGDKTKCIQAGANDYLSKPVDTDKLISLMRVWLYR